jgi:hypothetical protein
VLLVCVGEPVVFFVFAVVTCYCCFFVFFVPFVAGWRNWKFVILPFFSPIPLDISCN